MPFPIEPVEYPFNFEITAGTVRLHTKGRIQAPFGYNVRPLLANLSAAFDALASNDGQQRLEFEALFSTEKFTIKADSPNAARKRYQFTVEVDVSDDQGYQRQSTIHALAQTLASKPCILKIIERPREKAAKPAEGDAKKKTAGKDKSTPASDAPLDLKQILPSHWVRLLAKAEILTVDQILAFGSDTGKLTGAVPGLKPQDAAEIFAVIADAKGVDRLVDSTLGDTKTPREETISSVN